jgi:HKD family nuclease
MEPLTMTIKIYSNDYQAEPYKILDKLLEVAKRSRTITILSAYYDVDLLTRVLDVVPKKNRHATNVLFIFNKLAGRRLDTQKKELTKIKKSFLDNGFKEFEIKLISHKAIFHTKLYKFQVRSWYHWFIGSANATEAAFERNEEILIHFKGGNSDLVNYIAKVKKKSQTLEDVEESNSCDSLISFLRDGMLYFKPRNQIRLSYDALSGQKEDIKKYFRTLSEPIRNSEPGKRFGPFSIKIAVGIKEDLIADDNEEKKKGEKAVIRPYSIETSLGYWVPTKYIDLT